MKTIQSIKTRLAALHSELAVVGAPSRTAKLVADGQSFVSTTKRVIAQLKNQIRAEYALDFTRHTGAMPPDNIVPTNGARETCCALRTAGVAVAVLDVLCGGLMGAIFLNFETLTAVAIGVLLSLVICSVATAAWQGILVTDFEAPGKTIKVLRGQVKVLVPLYLSCLVGALLIGRVASSSTPAGAAIFAVSLTCLAVLGPFSQRWEGRPSALPGRISMRGGKPTHVLSDLERLRDTIKEAFSIVKEVETYLEELRTVEKKAQVVTEQIRTLREQIEQVYETIGMGMTAEALTHELENIATHLAERTQDIGNYARSQVRDSRIIAYVAHVKTAIAEFRRQLTFLAPSLKYVREQREDIETTAFVKELVQYYTKRFAGTSIVVEAQTRSRSPFRIVINRGKLIQVFDNLFLNSEYWLKDDLKARRISRGLISIETDRPFIRVSDNGRGVDPLLEDSVFEAFVSAKGKGKGRGLGLYIVQQLLGAEGCSITLLRDRNKYDRRFVFEIDLSGVLSESAGSQSNR